MPVPPPDAEMLARMPMARDEYERLRPRSRATLFKQKLLNMIARVTIHRGLRLWLYRQVGVNLSRSSRAQWGGAGYKVSKSDLRPGDLVFYYSPVSHVGLYIGNGKIVDAANPRSGVRVTSLDSMPFSGARRVLG